MLFGCENILLKIMNYYIILMILNVLLMTKWLFLEILEKKLKNKIFKLSNLFKNS